VKQELSSTKNSLAAAEATLAAQFQDGNRPPAVVDELAVKDIELCNVQNALSAMQQQAEASNEYILELRNTIVEKTGQIESMGAEVEEKGKQVAAKDVEIARLNRIIDVQLAHIKFLWESRELKGEMVVGGDGWGRIEVK
jgi:chromosome segregation ATPase